MAPGWSGWLSRPPAAGGAADPGGGGLSGADEFVASSSAHEKWFLERTAHEKWNLETSGMVRECFERMLWESGIGICLKIVQIGKPLNI